MNQTVAEELRAKQSEIEHRLKQGERMLEQIKRIEDAIAALEKVTCIRFSSLPVDDEGSIAENGFVSMFLLGFHSTGDEFVLGGQSGSMFIDVKLATLDIFKRELETLREAYDKL